MPKIQWTGLPPALRDHLFERLRERKSTAEDLYQLNPKTFLLRGQPAKGEKLWTKNSKAMRPRSSGSMR